MTREELDKIIEDRAIERFGQVCPENVGQVCPENGSFTAFKKLADDKIAKLLIPEHAKRSSGTTRKCRCSEALVIEIKYKNGQSADIGYSRYEGQNGEKTMYTVGETVYPDSFDDDRWNECSNGIHFFMTRREAEVY